MKVRTTVTAAVAAGLLALAAAPDANAVTYGLRWDTKVVYVYVDSNVSSRWYVTYDLAQWSKAAPGLDLIRTTDPSIAKIRVHQRDLPSPTAAETALSWSGSTLLGADITLDTTMVSGAYCSRRHTITHELGHAIGLDHNTVSPTSLMFTGANGTCSIYPNAYDKADAVNLYP